MSVFRRLYHGQTDFDFVKVSRKTLRVSLGAVVVSILLMVLLQFNLSIDFTGGVIITAPNEKGATVEDIRGSLRDVGQADARVQLSHDGADDEQASTVTVQTEAVNDPAAQDALVRVVADAAGADVTEVNVTAIGPTFGNEVTKAAIRALIVFFIAVGLFLTWQFEWKMAISALAALVHDLILTGGLYALIGFPITPATVIAVLTILAYSLYDTVVVYDKVKENERKLPARATYSDLVNQSMNQVLMRSLNTSLTSLLPVGALLFVGVFSLGGETLKEFALALFIGITVGTYSSLLVAAPILAHWKESEPAWERRRRRAERGGDEAVAVPGVEADSSVAPNVVVPVARPPKQRRKRR